MACLHLTNVHSLTNLTRQWGTDINVSLAFYFLKPLRGTRGSAVTLGFRSITALRAGVVQETGLEQ